MAKLAFDYSKWDKLDDSDDEERHHPNLDQGLNRRVIRICRDRKEEEIDQQKKEFEAKGESAKAEELEAKRPLHVGNICKVTEDRTIIQRSTGVSDRLVKDSEEFTFDDYQQFKVDNKALLEEFTEADWERSHQLLDKHGGILLDNHSNNYFLLTTLDEEMKGNKKKVKKLAKQGQIISQIHQLAKPMRRHPRDFVHRFFDKFEHGDAQDAFQQGVDHFLGHIERRAVEKKKEEADALAEQQKMEEEGEVLSLVEAMYQMSKEERMGPGGLDPVEVFESLPENLQECFRSGDVEMLKTVASSMPKEQFDSHVKRCIDAGLWKEG